jgi:hypothetical protein
MGWLLSLSSAVVAAIAGCLLAFYIGEKCVTWYRISSFEGGSGYAVIFMSLGGLLAGFLVGLAVSKSFGTGFLHGTGLALATVIAISGAVYVLARLGGDVPPELNGDTLHLQVEMRMAPGWQPSHLAQAGRNYCLLTSLAGNQRRRPRYGTLDFKNATQQDGRWIVPCQVDIHSTRSPLLVGLQLGKKTELEFVSPLPSHPTAAHEQWTPWSSTGFPQTQASGYEYRVRVKRDNEVRAERQAAETKVYEDRQRAFAALNDASPLKAWLPFANSYNSDDISGRAQRYLGTRLAELESLLADSDPAIVMGALKVLLNQETIPATLTPAIIAAGRAVLPLIEKAKQAKDPDDPDQLSEKQAREFVEIWKSVAEKANAPIGKMKTEIGVAAAYAKQGDMQDLAMAMR